jgi:hypothetical protein
MIDGQGVHYNVFQTLQLSVKFQLNNHAPTNKRVMSQLACTLYLRLLFCLMFRLEEIEKQNNFSNLKKTSNQIGL